MMAAVVARTLRWQRVGAAVAVSGSALVVWPADGDIFALPKATWIVLGALVCLAVGAGRAVRERQVVVPTAPTVIAAAAFVVALGVTTLTSTTPMQSFVGQYSQYSGFAVYTASVVLFLTVVRAHDERTLPDLVLAVVGVAVLVTAYGFLQWAGADPVHWDNNNQLVSTLGNSNFLAGWIGIAFPLCLGTALAPSLPTGWRAVGGLTALAIVPLAIGTDAFQGPATVGVAGVVFLLLVFATGAIRLPAALRGRRGAAVAVVLVLLAAPVAAKVLGSGIDQGLLERRHFWHVAVEVFEEHPVLGTGPDTFHNQFLSRRPAAHAAISSSKNAGAAHDVPLDLLAGGGVLVGGAYLAFVGLVGWRLVVAIRRRTAPPWLVAGVGAAWVAYQTQSLVSIDKPPLSVLHWALAGAVVVLSGPVPTRTWSLPGRPERRHSQAPVSTIVAIAVVTVLALVAGWFTTRPFRADLAAIDGRRDIQRKQGDSAEADLDRARRLAPWESTYTYDQVRLYSLANVATKAMAAAVAGARLEPGDSSYALVAANVADASGNHAEARKWFDKALRRDPFGLTLLLDAATSAAKAGEASRAGRLIDRALAVSRNRLDVWLRVGDAWQVLGDDARARSGYGEVLKLDPVNVAAKKGLAKLDR
ncbi:MAG: O-antigen ligase protein [Acidimicrobiales bacterium]|nr:O-antigen ligase protein [Acidimicrobiales bacterium]